MAYGKIKADTLVYDNSGSDTEVSVAGIGTKAPLASPTFTGDVTLTGSSANVVFDASDNALEFADSAKLTFGAAADLSITHNGTDTLYENTTGNVYFRNDGNNTYFQMGTANEASLTLSKDGPVILSYDGSTKVTTTATGVDVTGTATLDGITIDGAYEQVAEAVGALEIDCSTGNYFTKTISGNSTFTFANPAASGTVTSFTLELTHSSGTVTWPASVKWNADTAPTLTAGKTHLFMFVTDDGGTRYRGAALVDYVN